LDRGAFGPRATRGSTGGSGSAASKKEWNREKRRSGGDFYLGSCRLSSLHRPQAPRRLGLFRRHDARHHRPVARALPPPLLRFSLWPFWNAAGGSRRTTGSHKGTKPGGGAPHGARRGFAARRAAHVCACCRADGANSSRAVRRARPLFSPLRASVPSCSIPICARAQPRPRGAGRRPLPRRASTHTNKASSLSPLLPVAFLGRRRAAQDVARHTLAAIACSTMDKSSSSSASSMLSGGATYTTLPRGRR
jgi:hypothetical protein